MKNIKQYALVALYALTGITLVNQLQASTSEQMRGYGYERADFPHKQSWHPLYQGTAAPTQSTQEREYGWGYYGFPHDQPGHPQYQGTATPTQSTPEREYGWGYYGFPHDQPGHPQYKARRKLNQPMSAQVVETQPPSYQEAISMEPQR